MLCVSLAIHVHVHKITNKCIFRCSFTTIRAAHGLLIINLKIIPRPSKVCLLSAKSHLMIHDIISLLLCAFPYPLMSSVRVMPPMEALKVTIFIVDSPSVLSCSTVSLTTDSLPGPDTSTLPRYTRSQAVWGGDGGGYAFTIFLIIRVTRITLCGCAMV